MSDGGSDGGSGWDGFDFSAWGESSADSTGAGAADGAHNGHRRAHGVQASGTSREVRTEMEQFGAGTGHASGPRRTELGADDEEGIDVPGTPHDEGRWVSVGGVMTWEESDAEALQRDRGGLLGEVNSRWAAEDIELPPGAPDLLRIRATHAWLIRQRALETEAVGSLLLERRQLERATEADEEDATQPNLHRPRRTAQQSQPQANDVSPLDLALAEHQAAIETYERLIEALDELKAHSGPARVLVEMHLWITERLALLAAMPEATPEFVQRLMFAVVQDDARAALDRGEPTPSSIAEWEGCAEALLQARRRVEWVSTPEYDE